MKRIFSLLFFIVILFLLFSVNKPKTIRSVNNIVPLNREQSVSDKTVGYTQRLKKFFSAFHKNLFFKNFAQRYSILAPLESRQSLS